MVGVRQGLPERGQVEHAQLDEVGAQASPVEELRLEGLVQLYLGEESPADQMHSELINHTARIVETTFVPGSSRLPEKSNTTHIISRMSGSPR
jgi:hypothetical protein